MDLTNSLTSLAGVLGSVLALGGTFVVFKLDKITKAVDNQKGRVIKVSENLAENNNDRIELRNFSDEKLIHFFEIKRPGLHKKHHFWMQTKQVIEKEYEKLEFNTEEAIHWTDSTFSYYKKNVQIKKNIYKFLIFDIVLITLATRQNSQWNFVRLSGGHDKQSLLRWFL